MVTRIDQTFMVMRTDSISYPPRGLSREEAARWIGVGTSKFDQLVRDGRMPKGKRIDARVIWDRYALDAAFTDLPEQSENVLDRLLDAPKKVWNKPGGKNQ